MSGWWKVIAIVSPFLVIALGAVAFREASDHARARSDLAAASSSLSSYSSDLADTSASLAAAKGEVRIQTVTRTVYIKAAKGEAHVKSIDPQCANGDALVADFRHQLDGLRQPPDATESDTSSAVVADSVHGR